MIASLRDVSKRYGRRPPIQALRNVSLSIPQGARLMIVGESGSGKTTLAKCLAGWEQPDQGTIELFCDARPQLIPQEPALSLNPYWNALAVVAEPFRIRGLGRREAHERAGEWMNRVELPSDSLSKLSAEFSGGEQARLAIARALAAVCSDQKPGLLIFDESFSALDEELRVRLLTLLGKLQEQFPVTYAFLSHDLWITSRFADFIGVLDSVEMIEFGTAMQVLSTPISGAMKLLLSESKGTA